VAREFPEVEWNIARNAANLGMVGNWNACLMAAKGEFVKMMGQDDLLETNCLKKQVEALQENPAANLCVSAANLYSARSARLFPKRRHWSEGCHSGNEIILDFARRAYNPLGEPVTGLARRESMLAHGGYDATLRYWVDVDMWFQLIQNGACVILREALCGFRIHRKGASFKIQEYSCKEFVEIKKRYANNLFPIHLSYSQWLKIHLDNVARWTFYKVLG
jgi:glycosyltransferase involved in cell wall biosynthesis